MDRAILERQRAAQTAVQTLAPLAARTPVDSTHKALGLVVHGIGQQRQGSTLKNVAHEFIPLLRNRFDNVGIAVTPLDSPGPAEARIWFDARGETYDLRFIEVWWADCFEAPSMAHFIAGIGSFLNTWRTRPTRRIGMLGPTSSSWQAVKKHPLDPTLWQRLIVEPAGLLLATLLLPLLIALWVLEVTNLFSLLPKFVGKIAAVVTNICTRQLGDMWVYMRDPWNAARIRLRFEERFFQLVEMIDSDVEKEKVDCAFVIAHSMGSVVAYEALTGRRVRAKLAQHFEQTAGNAPPEFHLFTVGSALNAAWDVVPEVEQGRFYRALPEVVRWTNRYGTHDPVARGALRLPVVPDDTRDRESRVDDASVVNQTDVFSDHTAYWNNTEEIVALVLDRVTKGHLHTDLQMNVAARSKRIKTLAGLKFIAWAVFGVVFAVVLVCGFGGGVSDWIAAQVDAAWPDWIERYGLRPLLWSAVLAGVAAVIYSTVVKWIWNRADQRAKYPKR